MKPIRKTTVRSTERNDVTANTRGEANKNRDGRLNGTEATMRVLTRVLLWGFVFCFPVGPHARETSESPEVGVGLVCNSAQQVERFLTLHHDGHQSPESAVQVVNQETHDANACMIAAIVFIRGGEHGAVGGAGGVMRITRIQIVAARTPVGWAQVDHLVQYTAIFEKLNEA
jgi:hypothetical protein